MKKILVNLKDWLDWTENVDFAEQVEGLDITVFPSLPYLHIYKGYNVRIGSQKISSFEAGAHTGSISAEHLKDFGVEAVILNHRECQIDEMDKICAKIENARKYDIEVILCIGAQLEAELKRIKEVLGKTGPDGITIAYEPSERLELDEIKATLEYVKDALKKYKLSYLYGNNVTVMNVLEYDRELDVDGFLISSHALDVKNLKEILTKLENR